MKGKIDKYGFLYIERANGIYKKIKCPHGSQENFCGDWCALFGEPDLMKITLIPDVKENSLKLCNKKLYFDHFTDERKDPNNYEMDMQADLVQEICKRYWDLQERIEIIENIAKQIYKEYDNKSESDSFLSDSFKFSRFVIDVIKDIKSTLEVLNGDIIEFDDNEGE